MPFGYCALRVLSNRIFPSPPRRRDPVLDSLDGRLRGHDWLPMIRFLISRFSKHQFRYQLKIVFRYFQISEAEGISPLLFVLDEGQVFYQGPDFHFLAWQEANIPSIGGEAGGHGVLINFAAHDFTNGGEFLAGFFLAEEFFGGVIDDPVAHGHSFERLGLAVA